MATDFTNNNTTIGTSGGFKPSTKNTPLDIRTRVNSKANIESIPNPFVGMKIIVLQDETNDNQMTEYVVTSLKANALGVADMKVNEVVLAKDFLGISGNGMSDEQVQQLNTAYTHSQTPHVQQSDIPTKTSQLQNDSNFISSIPEEYITETELNAKGYLTSVPSEYITETELEDKGYLTEHQDLSNYALKTEIPSVPTKTSQLTNDSGYLTSVPSEYITETELNEKGYLTEHQDISNKANKNDIPTKTSQLTNDSDFISSIPSEYVTETELESKGYLTEHQNISGKADKSYVNTELAKKSDKTHAHSYNDLSDKPAIPSIDGLATKKELTDGLAKKSDKTHTHDQYLTEHQDISGKANKSDIPTKTSQLTNDSNFISSIPEEYVTNLELPFVNVLDFGAKGNYNIDTGEGDDDTDAIKEAHEHANSIGLPVFYPTTEGAYKIGKCLGIPIKTSVYFGTANIFIPEELMTESETAVFHVIPDEEKVLYRNKDNIGWGDDVNELGDFQAFINNWNNKNTDFVTGLLDYKFYDILVVSSEEVLLRTLGNNDQVMCKREVAKIGLGGIVDYRQYNYNADLINSITVKKSNTHIELKGGNFILSGEGGNAKYPGFMITRGDVSIKDTRWFTLKDERTAGSIDGVYRLKNCCDVSFDNIHFFTRGNEQDLTLRQIRDYMLRMETVMNISINKWIERGGWLWHGMTGSDIKNVLVTNSRLGTFDTHFNANDLTISNCHFYGEVAIMHSGGGKTIIEGCTYRSGKKVGACFLDFRADYMCMHKGQLTIRDCEWYDENDEAGGRVLIRAMYPSTNVADGVTMYNLPQCIVENCSYYTKNKDRYVDLFYFTKFTSSSESYVMPFGTIRVQNVKSFFVDNEYLKPEHYSVFRFSEPAKSSNYMYAYNDRLLNNGLHVILDNVSLINNRSQFRPTTYSSAYGIYEAGTNPDKDYIVRIDVSNCSFNMNTSDKYSVHANNCTVTGMSVTNNIANEIVLKNCIIAPIINGQYGTFANIASITDMSLYNKILISDCELYPSEVIVSGEKSISYDITKFGLWQSFVKYAGTLARLDNIKFNYNKWKDNLDNNLRQILLAMDLGYYNDFEHATLLPKQSDIEGIVNDTSTMHVYGHVLKGQIYQYNGITYTITSDGWITNKFRESTNYYTNTPYKHINNKIYKTISDGKSGLYTEFIHSDSEDIVWGTLTLRYVGEAATYTTNQ